MLRLEKNGANLGRLIVQYDPRSELKKHFFFEADNIASLPYRQQN